MEILPSGVTRERRGLVQDADGLWWVRLHCVNCGCSGGRVPEASLEVPGGFASYLCPPCHDTYGTPFGAAVIPDQVFAERVAAAQLEAEGRLLTHAELVVALGDDTHYLTKLAKDRT